MEGQPLADLVGQSPTIHAPYAEAIGRSASRLTTVHAVRSGAPFPGSAGTLTLRARDVEGQPLADQRTRRAEWRPVSGVSVPADPPGARRGGSASGRPGRAEPDHPRALRGGYRKVSLPADQRTRRSEWRPVSGVSGDADPPVREMEGQPLADLVGQSPTIRAPYAEGPVPTAPRFENGRRLLEPGALSWALRTHRGLPTLYSASRAPARPGGLQPFSWTPANL